MVKKRRRGKKKEEKGKQKKGYRGRMGNPRIGRINVRNAPRSSPVGGI